MKKKVDRTEPTNPPRDERELVTTVVVELSQLQVCILIEQDVTVEEGIGGEGSGTGRGLMGENRPSNIRGGKMKGSGQSIKESFHRERAPPNLCLRAALEKIEPAYIVDKKIGLIPRKLRNFIGRLGKQPA